MSQHFLVHFLIPGVILLTLMFIVFGKERGFFVLITAITLASVFTVLAYCFDKKTFIPLAILMVLMVIVENVMEYIQNKQFEKLREEEKKIRYLEKLKKGYH